MLGKGLESLIPKKEKVDLRPAPRAPAPPAPRSFSPGEAVFQIEVDKIQPNPQQPRKDFDQVQLEGLAQSIREHGIIQPLIVSKLERPTAFGTTVEYQLIAGQRRWLGAQLAGLERVPAIVRSAPPEKEKLQLALVENLQRVDLNPIEAARACAKLQEDFGLSQREIGQRVGKSRETIANWVRLLNLPGPVQEAVAGGQISESQGRLLLAVNDWSRQQALFQEIVSNNLSVRELRERIADVKPQLAAVNQPNELTQLAQRLRQLAGSNIPLEKIEAELRALLEKIKVL